jgi:hypothetical protein
MAHEKSKTIELRGRNFRIDTLSARDGSWILNEALAQKLPMGLDEVLPGLDPTRPLIPQSIFHEVQDLLLSKVYEVITVPGKDGSTTEIPKLIFVGGAFTLPGLAEDLFIVARLTMVALLHNLLPFFLDPESPTPVET